MVLTRSFAVVQRCFLSSLLLCPSAQLAIAASSGRVNVNWSDVVSESKTALSIQVCLEPPMRRSSPIHDQLFANLRDLNADYPRFQPWRTYPKLVVAELEEPQNGKTSWDFSLLDPIVEDFMQAANGHPVEMDISTIPQWMYKADTPMSYPSDPDEITWDYEQGTEPRDLTMKEIADYWARVAGWYTQGGFKDEYGKWHDSNHHFKFDFWEVLNEVEYEHKTTPELYTKMYDAIVTETQKTAPGMKYVGMGLGPSGPLNQPKWFEYFLDSKNHKQGIPIDAMSYHFYAVPSADETPDDMSHTFYVQADDFINVVRYIEDIRKRLSPKTATHINEVGTILPNSRSPELAKEIPNSYWNLSGGMFAYIFGHLVTMGIEVVHESELIDYPGQYAGTSLSDWKTGKPNARYWVLKLLHDNFGPGDKVVRTSFAAQERGDESSRRDYVYAQSFLTGDGKRKVLLVNKRDRSFDITVPGASGAQGEVVDQSTAFDPPRKISVHDGHVDLPGLGVAVVTLAN
jgi:hypothetical protein